MVNTELIKKIFFTCVILAAAMFSFCMLSEYFSTDSSFNEAVQAKLNDRLATAGIIFAVTKLIGGTLSLLQSIEIEAGVVFANMSFAPMEVLSSVISTIDTLSNFFLLAIGAILLQKFLLNITGWVAFKIIVPVAALFFAGSVWSGRYRQSLRAFAATAGVMSVVIFSLIPLSVNVSTLIEKYFLISVIETNINELELGQDSISQLQEAVTSEKSVWVKIKDHLSVETLKTYLHSALEYAKSMVFNILNIVIVYFITSIIIPILTVWFLWRFGRWVLHLMDRRLSHKPVNTPGIVQGRGPIPVQAQELREKLNQDRFPQDKKDNASTPFDKLVGKIKNTKPVSFMQRSHPEDLLNNTAVAEEKPDSEFDTGSPKFNGTVTSAVPKKTEHEMDEEIVKDPGCDLVESGGGDHEKGADDGEENL